MEKVTPQALSPIVVPRSQMPWASSLESCRQRMLLTARKLVQRKMLEVDADLRGTLRNFGLKVGCSHITLPAIIDDAYRRLQHRHV